MVIIGCGNRQRSDDAAGVLVVEKLRELGIKADTCAGQAADLIEAWAGADDVIVVDVVVTGAPVGTVRAWDARQVLISRKAPASTHGLGVAEAIELARVLGRLPARLKVYGIEGQRFEHGAEISSELLVSQTLSARHRGKSVGVSLIGRPAAFSFRNDRFLVSRRRYIPGYR